MRKDERPEPPQEFLEHVLHHARRAWHGEISEARVISHRNGASVFTTEREYFAINLNKRPGK